MELTTSTVQNTMANLIHVKYMSAKDGVITPIFHLDEEASVAIVQHGL